jgi:MFS family permease
VARSRRSVFKNRDFVHLWWAESVSQLGSQVSLIALPLVAITVLHATTFEVGALTAIEMSPFVLFGLPAGAIIDRLPRRPVLVVADIGRAVALASVPIAYAFEVLTYAQLAVVVFITGSLTVFFDVAYQSILPALVERDQLTDGNAKLEISRSGAQLAGPALGGVIVQLAGAARAVAADALSFIVSAIFIRGIKAKEPPIEPRTAADDEAGTFRTLGREIKEGLHYVLGHRVLRLIAGATATSNFFSNMALAVFLLYAVRELGYSAGIVGLVFSVGNVGVLVAAVLTDRITRSIRLGPAIWIGLAVAQLGALFFPLAPVDQAIPFFVFGWLLFGFGGTLYNIDQVSLRQAITPDRLQGRMNASMRFMVWGTMPFGSLAGGVLGATIGLRSTLWIAAVGGLFSVAWLTAKPVLELKAIPTTEVDSGRL